MGKANLFISYSHMDKAGLEELLRYVNKNYCRDIDVWQDGKLLLGEQWHETIGVSLSTADIVLLLLSPDFLQSQYINAHELSVAFQRRKDGEDVTIIPIYYRRCNFKPLQDQPLITEIKTLQGCAKPEEPLTDLPQGKKDSCYEDLQNQLNSLADKIITKQNIEKESLQKSDSARSQEAASIQQLKTANKIFISIPFSGPTLSNRTKFIKNVESKINRDGANWRYTIVPGTEEVIDFFGDDDEASRTKRLQVWMGESIYHIHLVGDKSDLTSPYFSEQYALSKQTRSQALQNQTIIWFLDPSVREDLKTINEALSFELSQLPTVETKDYEAVFQRIEDFDNAKQQTITNLSAAFSTKKKIFMFYDYQNDNKCELRRKLRKKIQENPDFIMRDPPEEVYSNQVEGIKQCQGAIIFYGHYSDSLWFRKKEQIIQDASNIVAKAVCLDGDEEEIEEKIESDVSVNEFVPIKGEPGLENGVTEFKLKLQENV
jgi:hypothetical protein